MTPPTKTPAVMGILNTTPDSFYDGGEFDVLERAVQRAMEMIKEGADIIDIGGESTGPGSGDVSTEEELGRVIPVLKAISSPFDSAQGRQLSAISNKEKAESRVLNAVSLSVDTYKAEVAQKALEAGATMINDVTAGRGDPEMFGVIAAAGCPYIMMHSKDHSPRTTIHDIQYDDVIRTIETFFTHRIREAEQEGVERSQIILDPGLGHFVSSDPKYSWEILERLDELKPLGCPILVSPSRKSFTAEHHDQPPSERLTGTLKATEIAVQNGANIIRTHDVQETKELLEMFNDQVSMIK